MKYKNDLTIAARVWYSIGVGQPTVHKYVAYATQKSRRFHYDH